VGIDERMQQVDSEKGAGGNVAKAAPVTGSVV
jgi:hypothetical protein